MRRADVIVVGAGVVGTFHAYFAAMKGYRTLLIERNPWPNDASVRNFGMVVQTIVAVDSAWAGYARDTARIYRELQQEHDIAIEEHGVLYLASTAAEDAVLREFAHQAGTRYTCAYLDAAEARRRYPFVQGSYCIGALLFPEDLTLDPRVMLPRLIGHLTRAGRLEYLPNTTIVQVEAGGQGCSLRDARGELYGAERAIICGGAEYRTLFPHVFRTGGMRICKLQMLQTVPQPGFTLPHAVLSGLSIGRYPAFAACPSYPLLAEQSMPEGIREFGIHLLFKQAPDGSLVIGDSHEYRDWSDAAALEESRNPAIDAAILAYGRTMLHLPSWTLRSQWNGYYPVYPKGEIYTETIDEAIHIVTGIGGKGMSTGPGFARRHIDALLG